MLSVRKFSLSGPPLHSLLNILPLLGGGGQLELALLVGMFLVSGGVRSGVTDSRVGLLASHIN